MFWSSFLIFIYQLKGLFTKQTWLTFTLKEKFSVFYVHHKFKIVCTMNLERKYFEALFVLEQVKEAKRYRCILSYRISTSSIYPL